MEIKTKYNIKDWVNFEYDGKAGAGRIDAICVDVKETNPDILIYYHIREFDGIAATVPESSIFPIFSTKEVL